jgi:hypothetical protein
VTGMSARQHAVGKEALARLPELVIGELRQHWRRLFNATAPQHLSRDLLVRALAHRTQELALGGLRPEMQRRLRQLAQEIKDRGQVWSRSDAQLRPGTRLIRAWQGRTYEVVVLEAAFSWQGAHYRSLSAVARKITGTAWSGPLFFGLKANRSARRRTTQISAPAVEPMELGDVPG